MNITNTKTITPLINRCYLDYDPGWPTNPSARIDSFKYHIEHTAGLKLDFTPETNKDGRFGYRLDSVEVVDNPKFTMWMLRWA